MLNNATHQRSLARTWEDSIPRKRPGLPPMNRYFCQDTFVLHLQHEIVQGVREFSARISGGMLETHGRMPFFGLSHPAPLRISLP